MSPKASLVAAPSDGLELYLSGGLSFHSNDARGTTITVNPETGEPADQVDPLVRSRGAELGLRATPVPGCRTTVALGARPSTASCCSWATPASPSPPPRAAAAASPWPTSTGRFPSSRSTPTCRWPGPASRGVPGGEDRIPGALENVVTAGVDLELDRGRSVRCVPPAALRVLSPDRRQRRSRHRDDPVQRRRGVAARLGAPDPGQPAQRLRRGSGTFSTTTPRGSRVSRPRASMTCTFTRRSPPAPGFAGLGAVNGLVRHLVGRERRRRPTEPSRPGDTPAPGVGTPPRSSWCSTKSDCRPTRQGTLPTRIDDQAHEAPVRHPCQAPFPG